MSSKILLAPVGAGKTEVALERLVTTIRQKPFARSWVLLATKRQEDAFRQRLAGWDAGQRVYFNVEFFNFYGLYSYLLDMAGQPPRRLNDTARFGLLRGILVELQQANRLEVFQRIAHTPGFVRIVAGFIYELKQNRVYPDDFARAAKTPKDHELSAIYAAYQQRLIAHHLVDKEGEGWLALDILEDRPDLARDVDLLLVDGYDQFTPVQADLLTLLASRAGEMLVTLTALPGREETAGRRFRRAYDRLETGHRESGLLLEIVPPPRKPDDRHPDLQHLAEMIFRLDVTQAPASDGVVLLEAPDPAHEVGAVLRRVKRLLLACDTRPDDILIALRSWERYQQHFASLGAVYGLPLALHYGQPLVENPALISLLNLLDLPETDFPRRRVLDVLRSPYFSVPGLAREQVDLLERISRDFQITGGRTLWLDAIKRASKGALADEDETAEIYVSAEEAAYLANQLESFFKAVTPPEISTVTGYVNWLETLIGPDPENNPDDEALESDDGTYCLRMVWQIRQPAPGDIIARDMLAMHEFKHIMRSLLSAEALLASLGMGQDIVWAVFFADLKTAVRNASSNARPPRTGRVLVTTAADARGLPHEHVFVLGLSEGLFPAQLPEDPLYLDTERKAFRPGVYLETAAERAADEGLFYELVSLARRSLTLSRPTVQDGKVWIESHLWRSAAAVFSNSGEIIKNHAVRIGEVVDASEAASLSEAGVAAASALHRDVLPEAAQRVYNWLCWQPYWTQIRLGRAVEMSRLSSRPYDRYTGCLSRNDLIAHVADLLGPKRLWSASQLKDYGVCGFHFFARRLLKLEALEEPEEGVDALQLGSLNHEILEETYRQLAEMGCTITPEHRDTALAIFEVTAEAVLRDAPEKLGFRPTALWEYERRILKNRLRLLIELDFSADAKHPVGKVFGTAPRQPYRLEAPFGTDGGPTVWVNLGGEAGSLRVQGYIDRMDRQGDAVIVVDYKTGGAPDKKDMEEGRDFQMMLYLLAAQAILKQDSSPDAPTRVGGGLFWSIRSREVKGALVQEGDIPPVETDAVKQAKRHLAGYIVRGRRGDFRVLPNKLDAGRCTRYCEFHQLCRVGSTNRHKRES